MSTGKGAASLVEPGVVGIRGHVGEFAALAAQDGGPQPVRLGAERVGRLGLVDLDAPPGLLAAAIVSLRVYAGYAGWSAGQLQAEVEEGAWYVLPAEPSDAFCPEPEQLWPAVLRRQGGELAYVATYPDDPGLN